MTKHNTSDLREGSAKVSDYVFVSGRNLVTGLPALAGTKGWNQYGNAVEKTRVSAGESGLRGSLTERYLWNEDYNTEIGQIVASAVIDPVNEWIYTFSKNGGDVMQIDTTDTSTRTRNTDVFNNGNGAVTAFHFTDWSTAYGVCQSNSGLYQFDVDPSGGGLTGRNTLYVPSGGTYSGTGPTVYNNIAYWVGQDGDAKLWAYDLTNSTLAWSQGLVAGSGGTSGRIPPTIVPSESGAFAIGNNDFDGTTTRYGMWDLSDGTELWTVEPSNNSNFSVESSEDADNSAAYDANTNRLVIGNRSYYVYCVDASDGSLVWEWYTDDNSRVMHPAIYDGKVYLWVGETRLVALNMDDGSKEWETPTNGKSNIEWGGVNVMQSSAGTVIVACGESRLETFDPQDGSPIADVSHYSGTQMFGQDAELGIAVTGEYSIQVWEVA